ncbi:MAG: hypothetical protein HN390_04930 [Anaerolineae bacterium]|jgi:hypothetical protein|nr:hypothetical protein [Anaerolineae bacterium]MBT7189680.1 hypothetical protein [Anaerolineae bacterium]MBT7988250.1 hypothetical protein [Anaerolineae bacterium]
MNLILGIAIGAGGYWLLEKSKNDWQVTWLGWLLLALSAASIVFGIDTLAGSLIENEMQAGWMGLGLFTILLPTILGTLAWRFSIKR